MKTGRGKEKQRDIEKRKRKSTFLFAAEGNNVTEKNYFKAINSDRVHVIFTKGNETDPVKLMNRLIEESKNLDPELGDRAFCLVDADMNPVKDQQIADADNAARKTLAVQIVSNPCFEIWFLDHFRYTTTQFRSSADAIAALMDAFPLYAKNNPDMYVRLKDKQDEAIKNAKRQEQHNLDNGRKPHTAKFQPSTEVYKIIEALRSLK